MYEQGYIKLHRSLLTWEWYDDVNTFRLFLHLLLTVNHADTEWHGTVIRRGQRVCSYSKLSQETGLSVKSVRTCMGHLIQTGEVAHTATSKYGLVTVNHYSLYQVGGTQEGSPGAVKPAVKGQQEKKDKNLKEKEIYKEKEKSPKEPLGEFGKVLLSEDEQSRLVQRLGKDKAKDYIDRLDGWLAEGNAKKNHYATILNWWRKDEKEKGGGAKWL